MRRMNVPAHFGPLFFSMFLLTPITTTQVLDAQAPAAGASVAVKMMEAIDSSKDPAGKQYRASVTKAVDAGNGVAIPHGAVAAVTLMNGGNGSGWTTHLVSVTINGQVIALTSGPASLTSAGQSAAISAMNSVGSMLGGFGHHVKAPSGVTAVAMGQRVVLPPGMTLTFVLSQPPAANPAAPAAPASQPLTSSAAPAPNPASEPAAATIASASGPVTGMGFCYSNPPPFASDLNYKKQFLTAVFEFPVDNVHATVDEARVPFAAYLRATHQDPDARISCVPIWTIAGARNAQKALIDYHVPGLKRIDTGWRYGQPPLAKGQSGFDPLTQGPGGLDLSQHRLTTYYCTLLAKGGTSIFSQPGPRDATLYFSPIFQADWDSDTVSKAFQTYMVRYVHDVSRSYPNPWCTANSPMFWAQMHPGAEVGKTIQHTVPVDFTYTPDQAAASHAATASANAASLKAAAALGPNQSYALCYSDPSAHVVYFSDIFAASMPPPTGYGRSAVDRAATDASAALQGRFGAFFQKKYGAKNSAICRTGISAASLNAAQALKQSMEDTAKQNKAQVVETGWKGSN